MDDCIFCKIVAGKIPCHKIHENEDFLAFLDIKPFTEGHTLIIPKTHYRWTYDVPNFTEFWKFAQETTKLIQNKLNPLFLTYLTMGNEVPHAHIHLLPRYDNDRLTGLFTESLRSNPHTSHLKQIADKINS